MGIDLRPTPVTAPSIGSSAPDPAEYADMTKTRVIKLPVKPLNPQPRPVTPSGPLAQQQTAPPPPVKTESVFCPDCTRENPKGSTICAYCRRPLDSGAPVIATPEAKGKRWFLIITTVLAVIAIVLIIWMMIAK